MDTFDRIRLTVAWVIAGVSGLWLLSCLAVGARLTAKTYLGDGSSELAVIATFLAACGLYAPQLTQQSIEKELRDKETEAVLKKYFG